MIRSTSQGQAILMHVLSCDATEITLLWSSSQTQLQFNHEKNIRLILTNGHSTKYLISSLTHTHYMLLLLSHFSRVRLCATPETAAHQAPPSLGFSRQEHWSGSPFPSPVHENEKWKWSLSDPMDCSLPGSSIHGSFQARVLEWGAIAFSDSYC